MERKCRGLSKALSTIVFIGHFMYEIKDGIRLFPEGIIDEKGEERGR
jgi:hypothetical protein